LGAVYAGVLFGGVWTPMGIAVGFALRLGEIRITFPLSWQRKDVTKYARRRNG
jgi:hypothetical protein